MDKPAADLVDLSVVIPTRNRAEGLGRTLESLARQQTGGRFTYEVVVVDNGSADATRQTVESLQGAYPVPLRYVHEARAGRPWALNAGLAQARGGIFVITDDDLLVEPAWLAAYWQCFQDERADGVSGRILPQWMAPTPAWLTDQVATRGGMGCIDHGPVRHFSRARQNCRWVGGNMAVRREVVERLGGFDTRFIRAQDNEYYLRCVGAGLHIVYEPQALAHHQIGADRMTPAHFRRWRHMTGHYHAYLYPWRKYHLLTVMPVDWYPMVAGFAAGWVRALVTRRPWFERFRYELRLREHASVFRHRLQLWPRWLATVVTGRACLPANTPMPSLTPADRARTAQGAGG